MHAAMMDVRKKGGDPTFIDARVNGETRRKLPFGMGRRIDAPTRSRRL